MKRAAIAVLIAAACAGAALAQESLPVSTATPAPEAGFVPWLADFRGRAAAAGIAAPVIETAFADVAFLPEVVEKDRNQFEFTRTIGDYLSRAVSDDRIALGRQALAEQADVLDAIEARYGVDRHIVVAIWGLESSYGAVRGDVPTISALATLAAEGRRRAFFEGQLMAALRIVAAGQADPADLRGSWAGAMGHTQFMPATWESFAADFDGDGRRDIWSDDPADALASTAAFLAAQGWVIGQPWGVEVALPDGFDYALARDTNRQIPAYWAAQGVTLAGGGPLPEGPAGVILLPAGARGAAFLTFRNFNVIERYNTADAYVIAVGHLADRLRGGPALVATWPEGDRALTFDERRELQQLLTAAGFDTRGIDGLVGPLTVAAVRSWQGARGLVPDGYASVAVLEALRGGG